MRYEKLVIESTEDRQTFHIGMMLEDTEHLLVERILWNTMEVIKSGLSSPTDIQGRGNMRMRPIEHLRYLFPISYILERHLFYRSTSNNHTIELLFLQHVEVVIECRHVLHRRMLWRMTFQLHES